MIPCRRVPSEVVALWSEIQGPFILWYQHETLFTFALRLVASTSGRWSDRTAPPADVSSVGIHVVRQPFYETFVPKKNVSHTRSSLLFVLLISYINNIIVCMNPERVHLTNCLCRAWVQGMDLCNKTNKLIISNILLLSTIWKKIVSARSIFPSKVIYASLVRYSHRHYCELELEVRD